MCFSTTEVLAYLDEGTTIERRKISLHKNNTTTGKDCSQEVFVTGGLQ